METVIFLLLAAVVLYVLFSFLLPPLEEEEEFEVWDAAELRLDSLLQGVVDPRADIRDRYRNRILAMGQGVIPRLIEQLSQELFLAQNELKIIRIKELICDFGLAAVPSILQMLEDEGGDPEVAAAAQSLLLEIGSPALHLVIERLSYPIILPVIPVLCEWGEPAIRACVKAFRKNPHQGMWRRVLAAFGDAIVPSLFTLVEQEEGEARLVAFQLLADFSPMEAHALFVAGLSSPQARIRASAVSALGKLSLSDDFAALVGMLSDTDVSVRVRAIESVAMVGQEESIRELREFLHVTLDQPERLEEALTASVCLASLGEEVHDSLVDQGLAASVWRLRSMAMTLIEAMPFEEALPYAERLLWDQEGQMVQRALHLLSSHPNRQSISVLLAYASQQESGHARSQWAEEAILSSKEQGTPFLMEHLETGHSQLALRMLLRGDDPKALESVLVLLQSSEDPQQAYGVAPEDLHAYLQRVAMRSDIRDVLQRFIKKQAQSPLAPALQTFLSALPHSSHQPLSIDAKSPEA
jgi:HEAT repeat protein